MDLPRAWRAQAPNQPWTRGVTSRDLMPSVHQAERVLEWALTNEVGFWGEYLRAVS